MIRIDRRAVGRAHPGDSLQILDRHRKPAQHPALVHRQRRDPGGMAARPVEAQGWQGIDRAVDRRHPRLQRIEHFRMGDFTGVEVGQNLAGGHADQVIHLVSPIASGPISRSPPGDATLPRNVAYSLTLNKSAGYIFAQVGICRAAQ
jgi:hypothetical protein